MSDELLYINRGLRHKIDECVDNTSFYIKKGERLEKELDTLQAKLDIAVDKFHEIDNWAKAYPLDVFPEPDFRRVRELLEAGGITLDSVSASNMRHAIEGVSNIVSDALKKLEGE
jgi:hypothetical protein